MRKLLPLIFCFLCCINASAEEIVMGMRQKEVAITATFDGSNILIFGAIKRETPIPNTELNIIVSISGPLQPISVHKKGKIWSLGQPRSTRDRCSSQLLCCCHK